MSAIAGIFQFNNDHVDSELANSVMNKLLKYPADDIQCWHKENIFLGCHAQWITPESVGKQIPYFDYERKLAITADAIIDNRKELFEKLQIPNNQINEISDTQLILLAYEKWGKDAPKYLVGDFSFMIWDDDERQLFGARDFSGSRTLYFYKDESQFIFCTVIQPFFSLNRIKKTLNEQWIAQFLTISDMIDVVDTSITIYKDFTRLK